MTTIKATALTALKDNCIVVCGDIETIVPDFSPIFFFICIRIKEHVLIHTHTHTCSFAICFWCRIFGFIAFIIVLLNLFAFVNVIEIRIAGTVTNAIIEKERKNKHKPKHTHAHQLFEVNIANGIEFNNGTQPQVKMPYFDELMTC